MLRLDLVLGLVVSAAVTFWLHDEVALVCSDRIAETRDDKSVSLSTGVSMLIAILVSLGK